jgi:hypothetical protein
MTQKKYKCTYLDVPNNALSARLCLLEAVLNLHVLLYTLVLGVNKLFKAATTVSRILINKHEHNLPLMH